MNNSINKFGRRSSNNDQLTNNKLKNSLLKTWNISINNNCLNLQDKKISNLVSPTEPQDAASKSYVDRKMFNVETSVKQLHKSVNDLINKTNESVGIKQLQEIFNKELTTIKENIKKLEESEMYSPEKINQLINKLHEQKIESSRKIDEQRFSAIEDYLFKMITLKNVNVKNEEKSEIRIIPPLEKK